MRYITNVLEVFGPDGEKGFEGAYNHHRVTRILQTRRFSNGNTSQQLLVSSRLS